MNDLPNWVYDLVMELEKQREVHPKLYMDTSRGFVPADWCSCALLEMVPPEVATRAQAIREYLRNVMPEPAGEPDGSPDSRADTGPASGEPSEIVMKAGPRP